MQRWNLGRVCICLLLLNFVGLFSRAGTCGIQIKKMRLRLKTRRNPDILYKTISMYPPPPAPTTKIWSRMLQGRSIKYSPPTQSPSSVYHYNTQALSWGRTKFSFFAVQYFESQIVSFAKTTKLALLVPYFTKFGNIELSPQTDEEKKGMDPEASFIFAQKCLIRNKYFSRSIEWIYLN